MAIHIILGVSNYSKGSIVFAERMCFFKKASFNTTISAKNIKLCVAACLIS